MAAVKVPVTQTKKSPMVAKLSDFFVFLFSRKIAFGARIVQDFFVFFPPVVEVGAKKRAFCLKKRRQKKWQASKKETTVITLSEFRWVMIQKENKLFNPKLFARQTKGFLP